MKALVYDCEIIKAVPPYQGPLEQGIDYCAGWQDHARMGVSVIGAYDYLDDRYRVFCADNFQAFVDLAKDRELLIGFNNLGFDDNVIGAAVPAFAAVKTARYDMLSEAWVAAGLGPKWVRAASHGGYGLDAISKATMGGDGKTGDGANAALAWQRGQIGTVIDYCLQDVRLTKRLFDYVLASAPLKCPKTGGDLRLRPPRELGDFIEF